MAGLFQFVEKHLPGRADAWLRDRCEEVEDQPIEPSLLKGALAGFAGGMIGSIRMTRVRAGYEKASEAMRQSEQPFLQKIAGPPATPPASETSGEGAGEDPLPRYADRSQEAAERRTAVAVAEKVGASDLTEDQKETAQTAVRMITGGLIGAGFGALAEYLPEVRRGSGLPLGLVAFVIGREAVLPAAGLSKPPTKQPWQEHLSGLLGYLAYGFFTNALSARVRKKLG